MTISKKNLYKWIYVLIFLPLLARFFTENFRTSYMIMPVFDFFALLILALSFYLTNRTIQKYRKTYIIKFWLFMFIVVSSISLIVNGGTSFSNFFYSVRPYFRMIIALLVSAIIFDLEDFENLYMIIEKLLYINVIIMSFQFIFQGLRQDIIGGTFGNSQGVNAIQNIFCVFIFSVNMEYYLKKMISIKKLLINTLIVLYIAVLAEITVVFFEVFIISILLIIMNLSLKRKTTLRVLFLIFIGLFIFLFGTKLYFKINSQRLFLLSFNNILEYLGFNKNNTGVYRISRVMVFSQLGNKFFYKNICRWAFGFGLGNCSTHSHFYRLYQNLQYTYFSSSNVFLETGLVGSIVNLGVIVNCLILCIKERRNSSNNKNKAWLEIAVVMNIIMFILFFYNTTLRDSYTAFFSGAILSIPYVVISKNIKQKSNLNNEYVIN